MEKKMEIMGIIRIVLGLGFREKKPCGVDWHTSSKACMHPARQARHGRLTRTARTCLVPPVDLLGRWHQKVRRLSRTNIKTRISIIKV